MELPNRIKDILSFNNFNFIHLDSVASTMTSIKNFLGKNNICLLAKPEVLFGGGLDLGHPPCGFWWLLVRAVGSASLLGL